MPYWAALSDSSAILCVLSVLLSPQIEKRGSRRAATLIERSHLVAAACLRRRKHCGLGLGTVAHCAQDAARRQVRKPNPGGEHQQDRPYHCHNNQ